VRELVARALIGKGFALEQQGKPGEAIVIYDDIVHRFGKDELPSMRELVAIALFNKNNILRQQNKIKKTAAIL